MIELPEPNDISLDDFNERNKRLYVEGIASYEFFLSGEKPINRQKGDDNFIQMLHEIKFTLELEDVLMNDDVLNIIDDLIKEKYPFDEETDIANVRLISITFTNLHIEFFNLKNHSGWCKPK